MKQKINCEIEIEAECEMEFVGYRKAVDGEYFLINGELSLACSATVNSYPIFRPVEPPLELETVRFLDSGNVRSVITEREDIGTLCIKTIDHSPAEARDLAKILNYWAEKGRLPKVKLRGAK